MYFNRKRERRGGVEMKSFTACMFINRHHICGCTHKKFAALSVSKRRPESLPVSLHTSASVMATSSNTHATVLAATVAIANAFCAGMCSVSLSVVLAPRTLAPRSDCSGPHIPSPSRLWNAMCSDRRVAANNGWPWW